MATLIVFIGVLFGGSFLIYNIPSKSANKIMLIYACLILTLFCGLIDARSFGTDIMNYYNRADMALGTSLKDFMGQGAFEAGYKVFTWVVVNTFHSAQAYLIIQALLVNAIVFVFIYKNSKNVFISLIVYVCLGAFGFYFTAFRQAIAMAICLIAIMLIKNQHRILAIPVILLASYFHQTAIVLLPNIFLRNIKVNLKNLIISAILVIIIGLFFDEILQLANSEFDMNYGTVESSNEISALGGIINIIINTICFIFIYFLQKNNSIQLLNNRKEYRNFYIYLGIVTLVLYSMRFYVLAMERVAFYLLPIFTVLYAEVFNEKIMTKNLQLFQIGFVLISIALFIWRFYPIAVGYKMVL